MAFPGVQDQRSSMETARILIGFSPPETKTTILFCTVELATDVVIVVPLCNGQNACTCGGTDVAMFSTRNIVAFFFALVLAGYQVSKHWSNVMGAGSLKREEFTHAQLVLSKVLDKQKYRTVLTGQHFGQDPTGILILTVNQRPNTIAAELVLTAKQKNHLASSKKTNRKTVAQRKRDKLAKMAKQAHGTQKTLPLHSKSRKQSRDSAPQKYFFHLQIHDSQLEQLQEVLQQENLLPFARRSFTGGTTFASMGPRETFSARLKREAAERQQQQEQEQAQAQNEQQQDGHHRHDQEEPATADESSVEQTETLDQATGAVESEVTTAHDAGTSTTTSEEPDSTSSNQREL